ncbi:MAG: pyridoxal-phosphate dependent enzyme [Oligoflexia bacterium]|nr:pyridoxal-phosphate dependent enzyme [Oligoflexia bacterium]
MQQDREPTTAGGDGLPWAGPRLGWPLDPSPVRDAPELASKLGLLALHFKRDDLIEPLCGGSKIRKLDAILASDPYKDAPGWASIGAIGSGHLVALSLAAQALGRRLDAYVFDEPDSPGVRQNLAALVCTGATVHDASSRTALAMRHPGLVLGGTVGGLRVVPPGATCGLGMVGMARAAVELARQVAAGLLEAPDVIVLPWGSGGCATGLLCGLELAGLRKTRVHAVCVVERVFSMRWMVGMRIRQLRAALGDAAPSFAKIGRRLVIDRSQLGRGYGHPTEQSLAATLALGDLGIAAEPVYSGKAWAALLASAAHMKGQRVLFWVTPHGPLPPPDPDWMDRLPVGLRRRLDASKGSSSRRRLLKGVVASGLALGLGAGLGVRLNGYSGMEHWAGGALSRREALVVAAFAQSLLPDTPGDPLPVPVQQLALHVDRLVVGLPASLQREIHALLVLVEHGTLGGGHLLRSTRLSAAQRLDLVLNLASAPWPAPAAWRGIRDLCMLALWQDPRTWASIGYDGPTIDRVPGPVGRYDALVAPTGTLPQGVSP